ncbi:MAG: isoleucine--tRNA ligase [Sphingomonadaceae bacterium]|nr:isoleucine--tRNA ligase [Sphingomonadaceae bacterium]
MTDAPDYRHTVFLPRTDFPMKAGLPQAEPKWLAKWEADGLYARLRAARAGAEPFILHDGPPYANGEMHIGHALNHTLKDVVCRTQSLLGKDAPYVPGWDCHGLPIEWRVEEEYRKAKKSKDQVPAAEFRAECRAYAQTWVDVQREQLKRLGIQGDWDHPYLTMDYAAEATIVRELLRFAETGQIYRGAKPVMWSVVEKTALAEAEVEYEEITSTQIDVAFQIVAAPNAPELVGAYAAVWTTTPWTIPVNQAIAFGPEVDYRLCRKREPDDGRLYLVGVDLIGATGARIGNELVPMRAVAGSALAGAVARHPMSSHGGFYDKPRPFLPGEFVTTDQGTGLVHMAPDHGEDDFLLCKAHGIEPVFAVEPDGRYRADWPWLAGQGSVINPKFNAPDGPICTDLRAAGALLAAKADYKHSYPHSWRSKAKLIYRATPQWFIAMDRPIGAGATLRETALSAIDTTRFVPERGRTRLRSMVEGRPDWVISRQRAWGVPITLFVHRPTGDYLRDEAVNARIVEAVRARGADAWWDTPAEQLLGPDYDAADYERVTDILDVWFDSGSTHAFVLESGRWPSLRWPADLYLEGSDQHRGWFQSSLLESCGTRGRAPFDAVLTHGFTMDASGRKMSKSLGNTVNPNDLMKEFGADILRLWALSVDFTEDHRIGKEILNGVADQYRKLRNTLRYLLGALDGWSVDERVAFAHMPELERWVLHRLAELDAELRHAVGDFDFTAYVTALSNFATNDLSAFYFDIRKDSLYCDAPESAKRRACRTAMDLLFHALVRWLAPVLVFTSEEAWAARIPEGGSVHLLTWPEIDPAWSNPGLADRWEVLRECRTAVTEAIEPLRRAKTIGSSNEARVVLSAPGRVLDIVAGVDFAEIAIVTEVRGVEDAAGPIARAEQTGHAKCARCWRHREEVGTLPDPNLCERCFEVVGTGVIERAAA